VKNKPFFITTPIYYVNARPHIGHAYTNILCDTFARFRRLLGQNVFFLTGTDEHGSKVEKTARALGKEPREYVDEIVPLFKEPWRLLGISYDYFVRTTDEAHKQTVRKVLSDLEEKGDIYKASYTGWYCTPCESFWTELQLAEGKCPDCHREVQQLSEENYFFKLSKYQDWLIDYIQHYPEFVQPEIRRNEILSFLKSPLEDLSITRQRSRLAWGIDYPNSEDHVVYVWFDALINYISAAGYGIDAKKFERIWPADVHMVGKDILRQHAVYWPIMLKAAGIDMPKTVFAHGWWTMSGAKVSKSVGNIVDPIEICKKYSVDAFRYFLLREVTIGFDGAFSEDLLRERYTSHLANDLGNLWFRFAAMLDKYFASTIPKLEADVYQAPLTAETLALWGKVEKLMLGYDPRESLNEIWSVITKANQFIEEKKPWSLAKDPANKPELTKTLAVLAEVMAHLAVILIPFLPDTSKQILDRLQLPDHWLIRDADDFCKPFLKEGVLVEKGQPLFPRLDDVK
jgi:methionyl-tRNA synthetase